MGIPHLAKNERDMGHPSVVACCRLSWTRRWIFTNLSVQIDDGYLTSRKKRARYGAPECCCMLQAELDAEVDLYGSFRADRRWNPTSRSFFARCGIPQPSTCNFRLDPFNNHGFNRDRLVRLVL